MLFCTFVFVKIVAVSDQTWMIYSLDCLVFDHTKGQASDVLVD